MTLGSASHNKYLNRTYFIKEVILTKLQIQILIPNISPIDEDFDSIATSGVPDGTDTEVTNNENSIDGNSDSNKNPDTNNESDYDSNNDNDMTTTTIRNHH
jgi:hypothetical protein